MTISGLAGRAWEQIRELYDLPASARVALLGGEANRSYQVTVEGRPQVLRLYSHGTRPEWIVSELRVLEHLNQATDLQVPSPIPDRRGRLYAKILESDRSDPTPVAMFSYVGGEVIGEIELTSDVVFRIGQTLGQLDVALQRADRAIRPTPSRSRPRQDGESIIDWAVAQFMEHEAGSGFWQRGKAARGVHSTIVEIGNRLRKNHRKCQRSLPHQLLHSDAHFDNLVFDGTNVGILDFDNLGYGPRIYELAAPLQSVHKMEAPENPSARSISPSVWTRAFLDGYGRHIELSELELEGLGLIQAIRLFVELGWAVGRQDVPESKRWLEQGGAAALERIQALLGEHESNWVNKRYSTPRFRVRRVFKADRWLGVK